MMKNTRYTLAVLATATAILFGEFAFAQSSSADASTGFPALDQWKAAVIAGDAVALKAFYSTNPAAEIETNRVTSGAESDVSSEGLRTSVLPVARTGPIFCAARNRGKFQPISPATTPIGRRNS